MTRVRFLLLLKWLGRVFCKASHVRMLTPPPRGGEGSEQCATHPHQAEMPTSWGQSETMLKLLNGGKLPSDRSRSHMICSSRRQFVGSMTHTIALIFSF